MPTSLNVTTSSHLANDCQRRYGRVLQILAGFELVLILATWPLWVRSSSFPAIPLISELVPPTAFDRVCVLILIASCLSILWTTGRGRGNLLLRVTAILAALSLTVLNQHRLQAWHWLFIMGLGTSFFKPESAVQLMRSVLASVYVCSSLSRMAPTAHQGMSAAIADQLLGMIGIRTEMAAERTSEILCHVLNAGELATGLLLIWPRWRRFGILSAILLHATLLLVLGPFGIGHHYAVLIWNICFLCLIPVVFGGPDADRNSIRMRHSGPYRLAVILVWLFPLSGLIAIADNWPAWQLYSTRPESWTLQIREADVRHLDQHIRPYVSEPAPLDDWVVVRLDRWSLTETESPIYPEDRFQCEVIRRVLATFPDNAEIRVEISEPERWFWWKRNYRTLTSRAELPCGH